MALVHYLTRTKKVTGPVTKGKINTSHSRMEVIKKELLGQDQFEGGEHFLIFGNALHELCLVFKTKIKLPIPQKILIACMAEAFRRHPIICELMKNSIREKKFYVRLNGVKVAVILDIKQPHRLTGADLKTTTCATFGEFLAKAIEYGYFRQGLTYKKAARLKHFYFIGITKEKRPKIYILDVSKYKEEEAYAEAELAFLLYFFKNYGNVIPD